MAKPKAKKKVKKAMKWEGSPMDKKMDAKGKKMMAKKAPKKSK